MFYFSIYGARPVYEPFKLKESTLFVLKESELIGIINLMVSLLLSEGSCGKIPGKLMPQTVLSLSMVCLKFLNNVARLNLDILQVKICQKLQKILKLIISPIENLAFIFG